MIEACPEGFHTWEPWTKPVPWRAYDSQPLGTNVATLSGGTPVTKGWTRNCARCRKAETT